MAELKRIKKGLDIPITGAPSSRVTEDKKTTLFAISPDDYPGPEWKAVVKPGDKVKAGDPLLKDKATGKICLAAPVSGEVVEVNRGERRHIRFISVRKENTDKRQFNVAKTPEEIKSTMLEAGIWALMRQRPFDIVPDSEVAPRDIFVTAFDSAPLAAKMIDQNQREWLEKGLACLTKLTAGKVYLGVRSSDNLSSRVAEVYEFEGPHPAGNVGTQIAAIAPVNKGEVVWTLDAATVARIGKLCEKGEIDFSTKVALTGPEIRDPHIVLTSFGASIESLLKDELKNKEGIRVISGNVLTGLRVNKDDFLHYPYRQITVIEEGDNADEFMGWASLNPMKYSVKRSFPAFLRGLSKPFEFDARVKGGHRAMILSG